MMKKIYLGFVMLLMMVVTLSAVPLKAASPVGSSFNFSVNTKIGTNEAVVTDLGSRDYASTVSFDAGTANPDYEFVTYIVNDKVESGLPASHTFLVTSDLEVTALYKPDGTIAVAFMDANQDLLRTAFVASGGSVTPPDISGLAKPGYEVSSTPWSGAYNNPTEDTVVWVQYTSTVAATLTLTVNNGTGGGTYDYNEVATVVASGTGNFQHWENEGVIVSLNPTYSFTVVDDTEVTAVFDGVEASPDPDSLFINLLPYSGLRTDYTTYVGQFVLPDGEDMVEFGLLISDYAGGITFDTPGVTKLRSDKYNPDTNEFVRSLIDATYASKNVRAYMVTTDGVDETVTYSDVAFFASDLFISEYIEGSSSNKAIEIYNGTGQDVDLTGYSIVLYANGSSTATNTQTLSGTLGAGSTLFYYNSSASEGITSIGGSSSGVANFNGDDAIALLKDSTVIDVLGIIGQNGSDGSGADWVDLTNHTVVRKSSVFNPSNVWDEDEWDVYDEDNFDYLGSHTLNATNPTSITITGLATVMESNTIDLGITYDPTSASQDVYWVSSNESLATVSNSGVVTGVDAGSVTITAFSKYNHSVLDTHSVTVTEPVTYTVTYEENGGSVVSDQSGIVHSNTATEPTAPTKADYQFDGWFIDDGTFLNEFDFATGITDNITLYAKWLELFTVTFDSNDGSAVSSQQVADGKIATEPTAPTKDDYVFDKWYLDASLETEYVFSTAVTGDITLYAGWTPVGQAETTYVEDFSSLTNADGSTSQYLNRSWTTILSDQTVNWTSQGIRMDSQGLTPVAPTFGASTSNFIKSTSIANGISSLSLTAKTTFSGATPRNISIYINDVLIKTFGVTSSTGETFTITEAEILSAIPGGVTGTFSLEIRNTGGLRVTVDDLTWTTNTPEA